jgi:hypothetical protein
MKIKELIEELQKYDPELPVMIQTEFGDLDNMTKGCIQYSESIGLNTYFPMIKGPFSEIRFLTTKSKKKYLKTNQLMKALIFNH